MDGGLPWGLLGLTLSVISLVGWMFSRGAFLNLLKRGALWLEIPVGFVWLCAFVVGCLWLWLLPIFLFGLIHTVLDAPAQLARHDGHYRLTLLTIAAMAAGLSALIAFPLTLLRIRQNERQTRAREQDLVTDRINKAVENLGADKVVKTETGEETRPNMEVRVGGLYALDRIARENLNFHAQVTHVLCAYVRQNSPKSDIIPPPPPTSTLPIGAQDSTNLYNDVDALYEDWDGWCQTYATHLVNGAPALRDDIHIAIHIIARRSEAKKRARRHYRQT